MEIDKILMALLPMLLFLISCLSGTKSEYGIKKGSIRLAILYTIFCIWYIASSDADYGDKRAYANMFETFDPIYIDGYKDVGWAAYVLVIRSIIGSSRTLIFFLITATIYVCSYFYYAYKEFGKDFVLLFIILSSGLLGFYSYGIVTIRNGFALAMILIGLCQISKKIQITFFLLAIAFHKSTLLIVLIFYLVSYFSKWITLKRCIIAWLVCLVLSAAGISLLEYADSIGGIDSRLESYAFGESERYNIGFRLDFIIYSMIPLSLCLYFIRKFNLEDHYYNTLLKIYILVNAFWMLVIRIPFTNRVAYLSWFMIPIIVLYPFLKNLIKSSNVQVFLFRIIFLLLSINVILILRDV